MKRYFKRFINFVIISSSLITIVWNTGIPDVNKYILKDDTSIILEAGQKVDLDPTKHIILNDNFSDKEKEEVLNNMDAGIYEFENTGFVDTPTKVVNEDNMEIGKEYMLKFGNGKDFKFKYIKKEDTKAPEFTTYKESYSFQEGSDKPNFKDDFQVVDFSEYEITIDEKDLDMNKVGKYTLKAIAKDIYNNETSKEFTVEITPKPVYKPVYKPSYKPTYNSSSSSQAAPQPSGPKTVNFDNYYAYFNAGRDFVLAQSKIDAMNMVWFDGNFYHHNTADFLNIFYSIKAGDTVIIGGNCYKATYFETASIVYDPEYDAEVIIGDSSGIKVMYDDYPDIITCRNGYPKGRKIWHLR